MIGKAIDSILLADAGIAGQISNRIYPIAEVAASVSTPSIYYIVESLPQYVKNGPTMNQWQVTILTMCKTYKAAWNLSLQIKEAIDNKRGKTTSGIKFTTVRCNSIKDDYEFNVNSYGQTIEFEIRTSNIKST